MRIGILGGTFDPPHNGHLLLAEAACETLELDELIFLPAHRNPMKQERAHASARQRLQMVQLAIEGRQGYAVADLEIRRGGASYLVDTLEELQMVKPGDYWFILGADALRGFRSWKQPERILRMCRLAVAVRPPDSFDDILSRATPELRERMDFLTMPPTDISSTEVRDRLDRGLPVSHWVPPKVLQYIEEHRLYRS